MAFSIILVSTAIIWLVSGMILLITKTPVDPALYLLAIISWIIAMLPSIIKGFL